MTWLLNRHTQLLEPAELVDRIYSEDMTCFQQEWLPIMHSKIDELKKAGQYNRVGVNKWNVEDYSWQWPAKCKDRIGKLEWASIALRCGGKTQGLMFMNLLRRARLQSQLSQHLVYVDLVSTAPWNRPRLTGNPLYAGVGMVLITEAILLSIEEGFEGRIGLHSLPGAEMLYQNKIGMDCLGPDPSYEGLPYYELTPQHATKLLTS